MDNLKLLDNEELVALARIDLENNQFADALGKLKFAKSLGDSPTYIHALLGKVYARLGLFERAQREFSAFVEKQPDAVLERFELGAVHRDNGNLAAAMEEWSHVLKIIPGYPPALFFKSLLLLDEGRRKDGVSGLQQLIDSTDPENLYAKRAQEVLGLVNSTESKAGEVRLTESHSPTH